MELHDIFPPVTIVEYSFYIFLFIVLGFSTIVYVLLRVWQKKKKGIGYYVNILERYTEENAKQTAYKLDYYGRHITKNDEQEKELQELIVRLRPFKYEKEGTVLPSELQKQLHDFLMHIRQENV